MVLRTGVPQIDNFAAVGSLSLVTTGLALGFVTLGLLVYSVRFLSTKDEFPEVSSVDALAGLNFKNGRAPESYRWTQVLQQASRQFSKPFTVRFKDFGSTVILPPKYTEDVKNNKDMSLDASSAKDFPMNVPGFEPMRTGQINHVFHDAVRIKLTQALTFFTEDLSDEAKATLPEVFPPNTEWQMSTINKPILDLVTRLSSLIFLGRDFQHIDEWQEISSSYTVNMFQAVRVIRQWHPWLRPYVHWFLPEFRTLRAQVKHARKIIEPEVKARRLRRQQAEEKGEVIKKSLDSVDWFEDVRNGQDFDFVNGELLLSVVAIHTTSGTLTNTLLDICANPDIIEPLREEIRTVIKEDGGLKRTTLHKLKLMDSVLKESQRLHPLSQGERDRYEFTSMYSPVAASLRRKVLKDVTLHDGVVLRKGTYTLSGPLNNHDESVYENPYQFDGYRYLKMREVPGQENKWQFVTTQPEQLGFGHGMHACPGRFFASNELKIALMHMLMKYDWKLPDGEKRPESLELGIETTINPSARLLFKARDVEVEF